MYLLFFSFSGGEIFLVVLAVLVLFGAKKIPELARTLGKGMNEFRKATDELKREFREGTEEFTKDIKESKKNIEEHVRDISQTNSAPVGYDSYEQDDSEQKKTMDTKNKQDAQTQPRRKNGKQNISDNEL